MTQSNSFLLGIIALAVVFSVFNQSGVQPAYAQQAGAGGVFAVTAPGASTGQNVLYVIDSQSLRLMVYEHRAGGQLKLSAVRNMEHELKFQEWPAPPKKSKGGSHAQAPSVKQIVEELKRK